MQWTTACPDWAERIALGQSLVPFEPLYEDEAEAALDVFKSLRIVDVAGQPTFGEAGDEWVFDIVRAIFGAYDAEKARRLIRDFFVLISKKNGKSTLAAGIMLTALIRNWRHSAELLILAPTMEIAKNSFEPARDMVWADEELDALLHVQENGRSITHRLTRAVLKVVAADTDTVGGKKAAYVLVDELWLFGKRGNAQSMLQEATGGLVSRPEGFVIYLTTQSDEPPAGVFRTKLDYFRDVRDGTRVDPRSLPIIYEFPKEMVEAEAYLDPDTWRITNPNIGRSVQADWIAEKLQEYDGDAGATRTFLAKHLNIEIGTNLRSDRWPGADAWGKRAIDLTLDSLIERSECITIGIDGGGLDDLFGLTVLGREPMELEDFVEIDGVWTMRKTKRWLAWSRAWCHRGVLERRKKIASRLTDFANEGSLKIVGDELADLSGIVSLVKRVKDTGKLAAVAVDPAGLGELADALTEIGITQDAKTLIGVPQGYGLMNAIKTAERKLTNGTLVHDGSALMGWCVGNLKIEPTATAIRATKQTAGDAKIDPVMALFCAVYWMTTNPKPTNRSPYEKRGIRVI